MASRDDNTGRRTHPECGHHPGSSRPGRVSDFYYHNKPDGSRDTGKDKTRAWPSCPGPAAPQLGGAPCPFPPARRRRKLSRAEPSGGAARGGWGHPDLLWAALRWKRLARLKKGVGLAGAEAATGGGGSGRQSSGPDSKSPPCLLAGVPGEGWSQPLTSGRAGSAGAVCRRSGAREALGGQVGLCRAGGRRGLPQPGGPGEPRGSSPRRAARQGSELGRRERRPCRPGWGVSGKEPRGPTSWGATSRAEHVAMERRFSRSCSSCCRRCCACSRTRFSCGAEAGQGWPGVGWQSPHRPHM